MARKVECDLCKKLLEKNEYFSILEIQRSDNTNKRGYDLCQCCSGILEGMILWPKDGSWKAEIRNLVSQLKIKQLSEALDGQIEEQKQTNGRRFRQQGVK